MSRHARTSALAIIGLLYLGCLFLAPPGALQSLAMGGPFLPPSFVHPLGTDDLGRDMLAALAQGGRTSLMVATVTASLAVGLGVAIGMAAGLGATWLDDLLMRTADMVLSLPALLVAILVASLFGGSSLNLALVLGLTRWPTIARIVRAETLSLRQSDFVRSSIAVGTRPVAIAFRHILPHVSPTALSATGIVFGGAILAEAALAFVGLGDPALTSWGQLIAAGYTFFDRAWWMWAFPALALCCTSALVAVAASRE